MSSPAQTPAPKSSHLVAGVRGVGVVFLAYSLQCAACVLLEPVGMLIGAALGVVAGEVPACRYVRQACERQLGDLESPPRGLPLKPSKSFMPFRKVRVFFLMA